MKSFIDTGSSLVKTKHRGWISLDKYSLISDCVFDRYIAIGDYSVMKRVIGGSYITIGSRCSIGGSNHPLNWLSTSEFQYKSTDTAYGESTKSRLQLVDEDKILMGSDIWIGDNVVIKTGLRIGCGAVIGAGSVVTADIGDYQIVAGNPARLLKYRFQKETIDKLLESKWWEHSIQELDGLPYDDVSKCIKLLNKINDSNE